MGFIGISPTARVGIDSSHNIANDAMGIIGMASGLAAFLNNIGFNISFNGGGLFFSNFLVLLLGSLPIYTLYEHTEIHIQGNYSQC